MSASTPFRILKSGGPAAYERDASRGVMLIGFERMENLGLGYLASTLRSAGYSVLVHDYERDPEEILAAACRTQPILIGFSLIFQFYVYRFGALIRYLREHGVSCHFTMGGHFPSLSHEHTLGLVPELDSVVRFEGEHTLLELVDLLSMGKEWRSISGIAYRSGGETISMPLRPLIEDLDELPHPERNTEPRTILGRKAAPILASRGCARTCSFCSIHMFYRAAPGKIVRTRKPAEVVKEMRALYEQRGITIFLFQDDDFPLFGPVWRRWAEDFLNELYRQYLAGRVIWKINCRADVVDADLFAQMRDAGLYLVYMGLESGTEEGLKTLHKQVTVAQNLRAVRILKQLDLRFEFGFMLFDPSTTFESVRENLRFLRAIVGDGCTAATFCRMLPYDGTPIKDELMRTGRMRGNVCNPDYDFLDPRISEFYEALSHVVNVVGWIHGIEALSPQLNFAWNEVAILDRLFPALPDLPGYKETLRGITRDSNELLLRVVEDISYVYSDSRPNLWSAHALENQCRQFLHNLLRERNRFIGRNQDVLLAELSREHSQLSISA